MRGEGRGGVGRFLAALAQLLILTFFPLSGEKGRQVLKPVRLRAPRLGRRRRTWSRGRAGRRVGGVRAPGVPASLAPDMPSGWPSAIAPPFGLTCRASSARPRPRRHGERLRRERLVQFDHVEVRRREPEPRAKLPDRRDGANPHHARRDARGRIAEDAGDRREAGSRRGALGSDDQRGGAVVDAGRIAGGDAFRPARNVPLSFASASIVMSARGCSSLVTLDGAPLPPFVSTATISAANTPARPAFAARPASAARRRPGPRARRHALPRRSRPSPASNRRRSAPPWRVDEAPADGRVEDLGRALEGASALPMTRGARVIDSEPPASTSESSPALIARAAVATASSPEAQRRLTVTPGIASGSPASSSAMRATLRLSSPAWLAEPMTTSSTRSASPGWRLTSARKGIAARSSARTDAERAA